MLDQVSGIHVELTGCQLAGLSAQRAHIDHDLILDRSRLTGPLTLTHVTVGGSLTASGTTITGIIDEPQTDGPVVVDEHSSGTAALILDRAEIKGDLLFDQGFTATGAVQLNGARVGGGISCCGGGFTNPEGTALGLDGARITRNVFLNDPFSASGAVRLLGAYIGGQLTCSGGTFAKQKGAALSLDGAEVTGNVFLDDRFRASGAVRLPGARVGGQIVCRAGVFESTDDNDKALVLDGAEINGELILDEKFSATGEVGLSGARISGGLNCRGGTFTNPKGCALQAEGVNVTGAFVWAGLASEPQGRLDLTRAHVGELCDDRASWPGAGDLRINGFTYDHLTSEGKCDAHDRLEWIRRQPGFSPQPYQQLAAMYRQAGQETEARRVLVAQQRDLRKRGQLPPYARAWNAFLGATIGHGYRAWRAALMLPVLYLISVGLVNVTADHNQFTAVRAPIGQTITAAHCRSGYPCLSVWSYPVDSIVPIINFHQGDYWQPDAHRSWGRSTRDWLFIATVLGWAATTLLVVAFTGLARKE
jgi:hypothetical protein